MSISAELSVPVALSVRVERVNFVVNVCVIKRIFAASSHAGEHEGDARTAGAPGLRWR